VVVWGWWLVVGVSGQWKVCERSDSVG